MSAAEISRALGGKKSGDGYAAKCPAHEDRTPSLSIHDKHGKTLVHCHAGCDQRAVLDALESRGLAVRMQQTDAAPSMAPPSTHPKLGAPTVAYDYADADGCIVGRVMRFDTSSGKEIRQARLGDGGAWEWKAMQAPRPLYRLPELLMRPTAPVLMVEGEKAADAARLALPDYIVTTWAGGSKAASFADLTPLAGRTVVLWPDADKPGHAAMRAIGGTLAGKATVRILDPAAVFDQPADGADAADVTDWNRVRSALLDSPEPADPDALAYRLAQDVEPILDARPLVRGLLLRGTVNAILGLPNSGKSFAALDLAAGITSGYWRDRPVRRGAVVYVAAEGAHGVLNRVAALRMRDRLSPRAPLAIVAATLNLCHDHRDTDRLADTARRVATATGETVELIVIDTLARVMGGGDENSAADMGAVIANLDRLRDSTGAAVLIVHHHGKDAAKGARGHSSLRAALDSELTVEGQEGPRVLSITKQRDMAYGEPMLFRLEQVVLGVDAEGEPVTTAIVEHEGAAPARQKPTGRNQDKARTALAEWCRLNPTAQHIASIDVTAMLKTHGIDRRRRPEVLNHFVNSRALTPAVGGFTVHKEML